MKLKIPELSLVILIGPSGSGKSTFARTHFKPTEVLSSDFCRGLVADDENAQAATKDAFEVLHFIAAKRLAAGRLTVIDATNVQPESRKPLLALARQYHVLPTAIVLNLPERLCEDRNRERPDRNFGPHVVRQHTQQLRRSLRGLEREGFRHVHILSSPEEVAEVTIERQRLWNNLNHEHGPFDIIGDVHGCCDELEELLAKLGYEADDSKLYRHPEGRKAFFVGDLVDRGPRILDTLNLVRAMVENGTALCVPGNHDMKLLRWLRGKDVKISHGLERTITEIEALPEEIRPQFRREMAEFLDALISHYVLDDGRLVVAHAGMAEELQGRTSGRVRSFALYGETTGESDEFGLPVRYNWAADYRGKALVVYGHTPVPEPQWMNGTINIDTGCVFGGHLTALRYPEKDLLSVPARETYAQPSRPFLPPDTISGADSSLSAQQQQDDVLDMEDVSGKRIISTRLIHNITVREENATTALEVMSRFAANPKWLIYLPPAMSPSETTKQPDLLEHPAEAFAYYRNQNAGKVICEEKHMGSRAVVVVCRSEDVARQRFGILEPEIGICYTRTGRRFFDNMALERQLLERVREAADEAGFWEEFNTDWLCLDCELMPWSAKAQELIRQQYAAVGAASHAALAATVAVLEQATHRNGNAAGAEVLQQVTALRDRYQARRDMAHQYADAYRRYCWPVHSIEDFRLAPFHLLATEGNVHVDKDHVWHMETLARLSHPNGVPEHTSNHSSLIFATPYQIVDTTDAESQQAGIRWWEELTGRGGEGMVVKPLDFIVKGKNGIAQPAIKCRGREYLRIIYGPEYTAPENLERLRSRGLSTKRALALREFALGIEALERFVRREPLRRVHECVFGVLALESEPVDPRL